MGPYSPSGLRAWPHGMRSGFWQYPSKKPAGGRAGGERARGAGSPGAGYSDLAANHVLIPRESHDAGIGAMHGSDQGPSLAESASLPAVRRPCLPEPPACVRCDMDHAMPAGQYLCSVYRPMTVGPAGKPAWRTPSAGGRHGGLLQEREKRACRNQGRAVLCAAAELFNPGQRVHYGFAAKVGLFPVHPVDDQPPVLLGQDAVGGQIPHRGVQL